MATNQHDSHPDASTYTDPVDKTPVVDMDDTTGSDGGPKKDRSSDETGDSGYATEPNESRSDTNRVSGSGISGGTGDTATTQSGGRSQY